MKQARKRLVTLNGSFDLLHAGHLYIVSEAKKQGDCLLVALNSDASIQAYKSPLRPIVSLADRLSMMAALSFVDAVTWFDETDPREFLRQVRPDVHANGAEYGEHCIEADVVQQGGGQLYLIPRIEGLSTSALIQKVKACG
ncbi:MAG: hypothetical protein RL235_288 [Chlamydiota bacterium]